MSILDWIKDKSGELADGVKKFRSKAFMEAVTAGCAMVAFADGVVAPEEKRKMASFIQSNEALKVYDITQVLASFDKFIGLMNTDIYIGKGEALKVIGKLKKNEEQSRLLVRVCCAIGASDGNFDDGEKAVVREICTELGLNSSEFGL
jgi:tellurite resistance protein TerB